MKRTVLLTMLALGLSLGANSVYAQQGVKWSAAGGSCGTCKGLASLSPSNPQRQEPWEGVVWLVVSSFLASYHALAI
jgi:hypothetical protein